MIKIEMTPEFVIRAPFLDKLASEISSMRLELEELKNKLNPHKEYYTLKEACE